jgi:hypothetical protein
MPCAPESIGPSSASNQISSNVLGGYALGTSEYVSVWKRNGFNRTNPHTRTASVRCMDSRP